VKEKLRDFIGLILLFLDNGNNTMKTPNILKSGSGSRDARSWSEYIIKAEQETPNRLEDAAKFLATMISLTLTLFLAIGKEDFSDFEDSWLITFAIGAWVLSLLASFFVLFPQRYRYVDEEPNSIKAMHRKVIRKKKVLLTLSLILFLSALCLLSAEFLFPELLEILPF
jgi:hypothetical protein